MGRIFWNRLSVARKLCKCIDCAAWNLELRQIVVAGCSFYSCVSGALGMTLVRWCIECLINWLRSKTKRTQWSLIMKLNSIMQFNERAFLFGTTEPASEWILKMRMAKNQRPTQLQSNVCSFAYLRVHRVLFNKIISGISIFTCHRRMVNAMP